MMQKNLFGEPDTKAVVAATEKRRRSKPAMARASDPESSRAAGRRFIEAGGVETHEEKINNTLYQLGHATGHEIETKMKCIYGKGALNHTQIMRRTVAMKRNGDIEYTKVRECKECGHKCQEMRPC